MRRAALVAAAAAACLLPCAHARAQDAGAPVAQQVRQGADDVTDSAGQRHDKSVYTLFDPTPDDQMRPFSPDRPGKSHSPLTVDAGHFQFESDAWNYSFDRWSPTATTSRATVIGAPNLKLGLTNRVEFDVETTLYNSDSMRSAASGVQRARGAGDLLLGGKVNLFGNDGGDQALGLLGFVKVPTAAPGVGNGTTEFFLNMPFVTALPRKVSLTIEPSFNLVRNLNKPGYQGDPQVILNVSRPVLVPSVTASLGLALDFPADHNVGTRHTLGPALQWLVTPALQLDAGLYVGVSKAAPDYNPYVGIAFRY